MRLSTDQIEVEPGSTSVVEVTVDYTGSEADHLELAVEGIDGEWFAIPVSQFTIGPGESATHKVFFKPSRAPESLAGAYPFSIKVRSLDSGEVRQLGGELVIRQFFGLASDIDPKRGVLSGVRPYDYFEVMIVNYGNATQKVQLFGMDDEDELQFKFEEEVVTLSPGQQKTINLTIRAKSRKILSSSVLHGVNIQARNLEHQSVSTSTQATVQQNPLVTGTTLAALILLAVIVGFWFSLMPKTPTVSLTVDPAKAKVGQNVTVRWESNNADGVTVNLDDKLLFQAMSRGMRVIKLEHDGENVFSIQATTRSRKSEWVSQTVVAEEVPEPKILEFSADKKSIVFGESFILKYRFSPDVNKAILGPVERDLNLQLNELQVTPNSSGDLVYTVVASNDGGKQVKKSIKIKVRLVSRAVIAAFGSDPMELAGPGPVNLTWDVSGAQKVVLMQEAEAKEVGARDSISLTLDKTTKFTLVATDPLGVVTKKTIVVKVAVATPSTPGIEDGTTGITPVPTNGDNR